VRLTSSIWWGLVLFLCCASNAVLAKESDLETKKNKLQRPGDNMFQLRDALAARYTVPAEFSEYAYTAQILHDLGKDSAYITKLLTYAKKVGMPLDQLFLGVKDSKPFTNNQAGYNEEQKARHVVLLKILIAQQFPKATASEHPTYNAFAGAPGSGKTFGLQQLFGIDVAHVKFADNAITVGPDLVVMAQMEAFVQACALAIGPERAAAMIKAYSEDRDASNAITNLMLAMAVTEGLNIVHDSTLTSPTVGKMLAVLGEVGYQKHGRVLLVDKESRAGALETRTAQNGGFALVTTADALSKAVAAYERVADGTYINGFD
jgi:hypothetical protein